MLLLLPQMFCCTRANCLLFTSSIPIHIPCICRISEQPHSSKNQSFTLPLFFFLLCWNALIIIVYTFEYRVSERQKKRWKNKPNQQQHGTGWENRVSSVNAATVSLPRCLHHHHIALRYWFLCSAGVLLWCVMFEHLSIMEMFKYIFSITEYGENGNGYVCVCVHGSERECGGWLWAPWISLLMWNGVAFCIFPHYVHFIALHLYLLAGLMLCAIAMLCANSYFLLFCIARCLWMSFYWLSFLSLVIRFFFSLVVFVVVAAHSNTAHNTNLFLAFVSHRCSIEIIWLLSLLCATILNCFFTYIQSFIHSYTNINKKRSLMQTSSLHFLLPSWFSDDAHTHRARDTTSDIDTYYLRCMAGNTYHTSLHQDVEWV